jgi:cell division protein FtsW
MSVQRSGNGYSLDPVLVGIVMAILLLGLVMLASASVSKAEKETGDFLFFVKSQLGVAVVGTLGAAVVAMIPTDFYYKYANHLLILAAVLLLAVLMPGIGHEVNGSRRWIRLAGINLQPSEMVRVLVLCWVAAYAARREKELRESLAGLVKPLAVTFGFSLMLLLEPDFGAAAVLFVTAFGLLFLAGARLRWVLLCVATAGAGFTLLMVSADYRLERLTCFLDPWANANNCGYQLAQSLIAVGRGEWFGVGLGDSIQKLFYLPEAHTDFLFAVLAEELGMAGILLTLALFLALVWRTLFIAREAASAGLAFQASLAAAFGIWVGTQALVNVGVNLGVLPTKGLTLPFMSYGRSSLLVAMVWVGMVLRVHHEATTRTRGSASVGSRRAAMVEAGA